MGTLQSPNPIPNLNPYPNRTPIPNASNPSPNPNTAPGLKSASLEDVSKLFSIPLSDAADSLGVCPSVLKKVCYDNGLVRWPYREAGKSIEEIKKDAAIEKEKQLAESKISGQGTLASSVVSTSFTPQPQSTNIGSLQQSPTPRMLTQQLTRDNNVLNSTINKGNSSIFDEFKYGFPSDGLSSISYRWWGNKSAVEIGVDSKKSSIGDAEERKQQSGDPVDTTSNLSSKEVTEEKKDERDADLSSMDVTKGKEDETDTDLSSMEVTKGKEDETDADLLTREVNERKKDETEADLSVREVNEGKMDETDADLSSREVNEGKKDETDADLSAMEMNEGKKDETETDLSTMEVNEGKKDETDADPPWVSSLSSLRKRAAEDGQRALKLGVHRGYNVKTLDRSKKLVLLQIFRSSLPGEWRDISSGS